MLKRKGHGYNLERYISGKMQHHFNAIQSNHKQSSEKIIPLIEFTDFTASSELARFTV